MTAKIDIRLAEKKDVSGMLEIYAPFILETTTSFELEVPTIDDFWGRVAKVQQESLWLVCEIEGKIAGYAYAGEHRSRIAYQWNREISVYVHPDFHKRKIASALYWIILEVIKEQGYCNALAGITLPNTPSVSFHEQFGFKLVGIYHRIGFKMGEWWDVGWWELPLVDLGTFPKNIRPMEVVLGSDFWRSVLEKGRKRVNSNCI